METESEKASKKPNTNNNKGSHKIRTSYRIIVLIIIMHKIIIQSFLFLFFWGVGGYKQVVLGGWGWREGQFKMLYKQNAQKRTQKTKTIIISPKSC